MRNMSIGFIKDIDLLPKDNYWWQSETEKRDKEILKILDRLHFKKEFMRLDMQPEHRLMIRCNISFTRRELSRIKSVREFQEMLKHKLLGAQKESEKYFSDLVNKIYENHKTY
ncbi:MAG: hypothetical protein WC346_16585 [Methanogenium sp.]